VEREKKTLGNKPPTAEKKTNYRHRKAKKVKSKFRGHKSSKKLTITSVPKNDNTNKVFLLVTRLLFLFLDGFLLVDGRCTLDHLSSMVVRARPSAPECRSPGATYLMPVLVLMLVVVRLQLVNSPVSRATSSSSHRSGWLSRVAVLSSRSGGAAG
jgi:hypothetical protein